MKTTPILNNILDKIAFKKNQRGIIIMKRKVKFNAARNNNFTPTESLPDTEFSAEANYENPAKGANRNSKKDYQSGKEKE
jgi:hypothetical protein